MMRWLLDEGHMDPMATRQIDKILAVCPEVALPPSEPAIPASEVDLVDDSPDEPAGSARGPNPVRYVVDRDWAGPGYIVVQVTRVVMEFGHSWQSAMRVAEALQAEGDADWDGTL